MSTMAQTFGRRIARERTRLGWSRSELARKAGINGKNLGGYERGENEPGVFKAAGLAAALGVSLDALLAPPSCWVCDGTPPAGMTCNTCGTGGAP